MGEAVARQVYGVRSDLGGRVVAAIDARAERGRAVAAVLGCAAFPSLDAAGAATAIDAVDIRLPHDLHADAVVDALRRGYHVLVEKPLATSSTDGHRILQAARASGRVVAVAENYPHLRAVRAARAALDEGLLGQVLALRSTRAYTLDGVWLRDGWRKGGGPSSGVLLDQGTHHVSMLRQLGGEVVSVSALSSGADGMMATPGTASAQGTGSGRARDTVTVSMRFASGLVAQSLYCWTTPALPVETEGLVLGSEGRIEIRVSYESAEGRAWLFDKPGPAEPISAAENYYDSHLSIVEDWLSAIRTGAPPAVSVEEALADLEVVLAAARSLNEDGQAVSLAELRNAPLSDVRDE